MWTAAVISRGFDLVFLMDKLELLAFRLHILHLSGVITYIFSPQVIVRGDRERRRAELPDQSVMIEAFGACGETILFAAQYKS